MEAVKDGKFHIWQVDHVDQGIELLTGIPAGSRNDDGDYPEGTINFLVNQRLEDLAQGIKEFEESHENEAEEEQHEKEHSHPEEQS